MNGADFAILTIIFLSAINSLVEGFVREVLSLVAWVLSLGIALSFVDELAILFKRLIPFADLRISIALMTLFVVAFFIILWFNHLILRSSGYVNVSMSERFLGVPFGLAKASVLITLLVLLAGLTHLPSMQWWQTSQLIGYFQQAAQVLCTQLPADIAIHFNFNPVPP